MKTTILATMLALAFASTATAAEIVPVNTDPAGQGLNDTTPLAPAGGNPGTTIGEQRRIAYQFAADLWGGVLQSNVQIRVQARFQPLRCDATGTVLGSAGTRGIYILTEAGKPDTLYHEALTDSLVGFDIAPTQVDIVTQFNSSFGRTNPNGTPCSPGSGWYYGLDGKTPSGLTNFLNTVMHEIAHGLGFAGFGNVSTGAPLAGYQDIYSRFVFDNNSARNWYAPTMDNAGRQAAVIGGNLVFQGATVTAEVPLVLGEKVALRTSGTVNGNFDYGDAAFGPTASASNFNGAVVLANDGVGDTADACQPLPAGSLTGKVAFINRGSCSFEPKVANAQAAGATAVIVGNIVAGSPITMGGTADPDPTIPSVNISLADANTIKAGLPGVNATTGPIPGVRAGADAAGFARLFAPNPVQPGSSFSHYDTSHSPNALMEPAITSTLMANLDLDLTPALFKDEGWLLNPGNGRIGTCDTTVDAVSVGGLAIGASIESYSKVCLKNAAGNRTTYLRCVSDYAAGLQRAGAINSAQLSKVRTCASQVTPTP